MTTRVLAAVAIAVVCGCASAAKTAPCGKAGTRACPDAGNKESPAEPPQSDGPPTPSDGGTEAPKPDGSPTADALPPADLPPDTMSMPDVPPSSWVDPAPEAPAADGGVVDGPIVEVPAGCVPTVLAGPVLTGNATAGHDRAGLTLVADASVVLTGFVFENQGKADTVELLDATSGVGAAIYSVPVPPGSTKFTASVAWALDAGHTYELVQTSKDNALHDGFSPWPVTSADIHVSGGVMDGLPASCCWFSFREIATCKR